MACSEYEKESRAGNDHIIPIRTGGNHPMHVTREAQAWRERNITKSLEPTLITQDAGHHHHLVFQEAHGFRGDRVRLGAV